jgi:hypothetical protein
VNPDIKRRWIEWLRANPNRQGFGSLHAIDRGSEYNETTQIADGDKFCCLGVLCHLAYLDGATQRWVKPASNLGENQSLYTYGDPAKLRLSSGGYLPPSVMEWAGLEDVNPRATMTRADQSDYLSSLAGLNDSQQYSFEAIADIIEEQL